jgi:hypothetical protein
MQKHEAMLNFPDARRPAVDNKVTDMLEQHVKVYSYQNKRS